MKTNARLLTRVASALALAAIAVPANAQVVSYRPSSKSEAILGGAPSALAAILSQQSDRRDTPAPAAAPYGSLPLRPAVLNYDRSPPSTAPVSNDQPDVFNSVALSIGRSPLDARWHQVSSAGVGGNAGAFAASLRDQAIFTKLEAVNSYVNARVRFIDDRIQYGVADRWQTAGDTLSRARGDCEDFALAKRAMLRAAGVPDRDLYLVVLKDLTRRADHAVLVVRAQGRFLVLDNGTDRIVDSSNLTDYKPILTFTSGRTYTHGYRRTQPPVTFASNIVSKPVALAETTVEPASGDQPPAIVETASLAPVNPGF